MTLLSVGGLAAIASVGMGVAQPASAATVSVQGIDASSIINNIVPSGPFTPVLVGDTFEIDFSNLFNTTPGSFSVINDYSLQIANIGTGTLSFSDVELFVVGTIDANFFSDPGNPNVVAFNDTISIWQQTSDPGFAPQTGQGISDFSVNGAGQNFGVGTAFKSANFKLTGPNIPAFGMATAGLINTIPLDLSSVGVQTFTSAKIRGKLSGSTASNSLFSAGLGIFTTNSPTTAPPNFVYGNAFSTPVPGPLPLFGAAAAFGWSRKLRRRLGATATAA
ncbi:MULTISPECIES: hypothetical protein [unclassified Cyanobium]|uniref:hypothetical protein n=1 Tax=unclassified Cyanobium TaxID=2627006 RepID=UPI0020CCF2B9|nr:MULTISPECIES: hypothetical protein [unclassified Cyanobium]MCP9858490.1 hypothetical protein [Cyanobium sp. Cruz-8H5]MCP9865854.1 hypothetical protein [Cyanobium sp. Cruz-8D1]